MHTLPWASLLAGTNQIVTPLAQTESSRLPAIDTLFLGNLSSYQEIIGRLALLAAQSKDLNPVNGRPKSGSLVAFVERITKQPEFLAGLDNVFRHHRIQIGVSSVENVKIAQASTLPNFEDLKRNRARPEDRFPSNCLLWIRLIHSK